MPKSIWQPVAERKAEIMKASLSLKGELFSSVQDVDAAGIQVI